MRDHPDASVSKAPTSTRTEYRELHLPPPDQVERALDLEKEDDASLPGLVRLNVIRAPAMRLAGFNLFLLIALAHNALLERTPDLATTLSTVALVEGYALGSWALLWAFFARVQRVHLGTVFLVADLFVMDVVLLYTGGPESLLWPVFIIRVADQLFAGRGRSFGMLLGGLLAYGLLLLYVSWTDWGPVDPARELIKLSALAAVGAYLVISGRIPLGLQDRALRAKELILQLEEQTLALNRERLRAEEASRAKSEFLARMSHELRTPMNSVIGFTNVLQRSKAIPANSREAGYLARIRENGVHLLALINDVLDLSRIEEGKLPVQLSEVELNALVKGTVAQLEGRAPSGSVSVVTELPEGSLTIRTDEVRMRQILNNLVGNALKFTKEGSVVVTLEVDPETGGPTAIHVRDTGPGIHPRRLSQIFHPFEQENGTYTRSHGGTGLGLAISSTLCRLMGFHLLVRSELGKGSTFSVILSPEPGAGDSTPA